MTFLSFLPISKIIQNKLKRINYWNSIIFFFQRTQAPSFHENCSAASCFCSWHLLTEPKPYLRADQRECVYSGSWEMKQTRAISSGLSGPVWVAENFQSKSSLSKLNPMIGILNKAQKVKPGKGGDWDSLLSWNKHLLFLKYRYYLQEMRKAMNKGNNKQRNKQKQKNEFKYWRALKSRESVLAPFLQNILIDFW